MAAKVNLLLMAAVLLLCGCRSSKVMQRSSALSQLRDSAISFSAAADTVSAVSFAVLKFDTVAQELRFVCFERSVRQVASRRHGVRLLSAVSDTVRDVKCSSGSLASANACLPFYSPFFKPAIILVAVLASLLIFCFVQLRR